MLRMDSTDVHAGALSEAELIGLADQALNSLNARLLEDDLAEVKEILDASVPEAAEIRTALRTVLEAWDEFANHFREP